MLNIFLCIVMVVATVTVWLFGAKVIAHRFGWTDVMGIFQSRLLMALVMWVALGIGFFGFLR
jgi:hypothetical protein